MHAANLRRMLSPTATSAQPGEPEAPSVARVRSKAVLATIVILIGWALTLWGFWPGWMSFDSGDQYAQVLSGRYNDVHPPLMAETNAISPIVLVGAMMAAAHTETTARQGMGELAVALAALNIIGGFLVTRRILEM